MSLNEFSLATKFFYRWYDAVRERKEWEDNIEEEFHESEYASENGMDSVYWCWNCKYSECERHPVIWERETLSDTDSE
jgi:hypothetical protein